MKNTTYTHSPFSGRSIISGWKLILFFFWPFAAFINSIQNFERKGNARIIYFFFILYGATFVFGTGLDSVLYARDFTKAATLPFTEFWNIVLGIYSTEASLDIISPLIIFIVSRFTGNPQVLYAVYAAIFGFFYLKSFYVVIDNFYCSKNYNILIFLTFFVFTNTIFNINGFRFNMAIWLFFYGAVNIIIKKNYWFFVYCILSVFTHFSFFPVIIILLIYILLGNRDFIYIPLMILSFIMPNLLVPYFESFSSFIGEGVNTRLMGYTNREYISAVNDQVTALKWFMNTNILNYYLLLLLIYLRVKYKKVFTESNIQSIFSISMLFLAFANFISLMPSGSRFMRIFYLFASLLPIIIFGIIKTRKIHWITFLGVIPIGIYILVILRQGTETINAWLLTFMPFPLLGEPISLASIFFN